MEDRSRRRSIIIVLDSVGCGELPDAARFGDRGSDTLGNLGRYFDQGLRLPHLSRLGLGNIAPIRGVEPTAEGEAAANWGRCAERSGGKDSTIGHWEIAGAIKTQPFRTYPAGFPPDIIEPFCERIGRSILGNCTASGTQIIEALGPEHLKTGKPIVYTSADSVFQIAAHAMVIALDELYAMCRQARELLTGDHEVARVIARPFTGSPGMFQRTDDRKDFSVPPPEPTLLDRCQAAGVEVVGIGKIGDLFAHRSLDREVHTHGNQDGVDRTLEAMNGLEPPALIFVNLIDFDMLYGHRNDPGGYRSALEEFDARVPELNEALREDDLIILTADHGNDPTTLSTDHSREYIPLLAWGRRFGGGVDLGTRPSFADIGQTVADHLGLEPLEAGESFLKQMLAPRQEG